MSSISFFTPVQFSDRPAFFMEKLTQGVDDYFYLGGRVAVVLPKGNHTGSEGVLVKKGEANWYCIAIKIVSYITLIIPMLMLIAKVILRSHYRFHECSLPKPVPPIPKPVPQQHYLPVFSPPLFQQIPLSHTQSQQLREKFLQIGYPPAVLAQIPDDVLAMIN